MSNIDAALAFYRDRRGFVLDVDYRPTSSFLVVQLTPSGSSCSIHLELSHDAHPLSGLVLALQTWQRPTTSGNPPALR
ncbi:MAG: hypothetical protein WKF57_22415 [Nakamurella sp.]